MGYQLNLERLREQAKERVREQRVAGQQGKLADVQLELARELGFASWTKLKAYVERLSFEQPFAGSIRSLVDLGADPNQRGSFGGPSHGEGVTAIHLAAQAGQRESVVVLLEVGADPLILDSLHGGNALGWARVGGHEDLADILP
ncbi:MAG TPA: hypothetical protein VG294_00350 [Solirubrobacteraceae bacterium]|nr:hypothetical protein [Solirubrobacteraceae bacterium]